MTYLEITKELLRGCKVIMLSSLRKVHNFRVGYRYRTLRNPKEDYHIDGQFSEDSYGIAINNAFESCGVNLDWANFDDYHSVVMPRFIGCEDFKPDLGTVIVCGIKFDDSLIAQCLRIGLLKEICSQFQHPECVQPLLYCVIDSGDSGVVFNEKPVLVTESFYKFYNPTTRTFFKAKKIGSLADIEYFDTSMPVGTILSSLITSDPESIDIYIQYSKKCRTKERTYIGDSEVIPPAFITGE